MDRSSPQKGQEISHNLNQEPALNKDESCPARKQAGICTEEGKRGCVSDRTEAFAALLLIPEMGNEAHSTSRPEKENHLWVMRVINPPGDGLRVNKPGQ